MVDFRINVVVDPSGAQAGTTRVEQGLNRLGNTANRVQRLITGVFAFAGLSLGIRGIINLADSFTSLQNQVRVAQGGIGDLAATTERLFEISNRTRTSVEANVQLFQRLSFAAGELGASQEQLFQFVETVGNALAIQGGAASQASGALLQLSQAVGSGIVRAEEFNSILEGAFPIALAVAKGLDAAGGSVARLRSLIIAGEVTSTQFFDALLSQSDALEEAFARTTPTIGQAFTVLRNNFTRLIGEFDSSRGITAVLAQTIIVLAGNLDQVVEVAIAVGAALTAAFAPALVRNIFAAATATAQFLIALGPIGLAAATITSLLIATDQLTGGLFELEGITVTLGDVITATFTVANDLFNQVSAVLVGVLAPAFDEVGFSVNSLRDILAVVFNSLVSFVDAAIGLAVGTARGLSAAFENFPDILAGIVLLATIKASEILNGFVNFAIDLLNELPGVEIAKVPLERFGEQTALAAVEATNKVTEAFQSGLELSVVGDLVDLIGEEAAAVARLRIERENATEIIAENNEETEEAIKLTQRQLDLLDEINKPAREYAETLEDLTALLDRGRVSQEQFNEVLRDARIEFLETEESTAAGFERGFLKAQADIDDFASSSERVITDAFAGAQDAVVEFFQTGKFEADDFFKTLSENLLRLGVQQAFAAALGQGGAAGGVGGASTGTSAGNIGGLVATGLSAFLSAQDGLNFTVNDRTSLARLPGVDNRLIGVKARDGEEVDIRPPGQGPGGGRGVTVIQNIRPRDFDSFRRTSGQNATQASVLFNRERRKR